MSVTIRWTDIAAFAFAAVIAWGKLGGELPAIPLPSPAPVVNPVAAPSAEMQGFVSPLKSLAATNQKPAAAVGRAFADFARVLGRNPDSIKSSGQLKATITRFASLLAANNPEAAKLPGLSAALEQAHVAAFGETDAATDKAGEFVSAVAWALGS